LLELVVVTTGRITDRGRRATGEPFTVVTLVTFVWARRPSDCGVVSRRGVVAGMALDANVADRLVRDRALASPRLA